MSCCLICHAPFFQPPDYYPDDIRRKFFEDGDHLSCQDKDACEVEYHMRKHNTYDLAEPFKVSPAKGGEWSDPDLCALFNNNQHEAIAMRWGIEGTTLPSQQEIQAFIDCNWKTWLGWAKDYLPEFKARQARWARQMERYKAKR